MIFNVALLLPVTLGVTYNPAVAAAGRACLTDCQAAQFTGDGLECCMAECMAKGNVEDCREARFARAVGRAVFARATDLPACTCAGYPSGAGDGTELCKFRSGNCALASKFGGVCPSKAEPCTLSIEESSEDTCEDDTAGLKKVLGYEPDELDRDGYSYNCESAFKEYGDKDLLCDNAYFSQYCCKSCEKPCVDDLEGLSKAFFGLTGIELDEGAQCLSMINNYAEGSCDGADVFQENCCGTCDALSKQGRSVREERSYDPCLSWTQDANEACCATTKATKCVNECAECVACQDWTNDCPQCLQGTCYKCLKYAPKGCFDDNSADELEMGPGGPEPTMEPTAEAEDFEAPAERAIEERLHYLLNKIEGVRSTLG